MSFGIEFKTADGYINRFHLVKWHWMGVPLTDNNDRAAASAEKDQTASNVQVDFALHSPQNKSRVAN